MGNERYAQLSKQYSRKAQGIMLVYSVTWSQSLNSIEKWYNYLKENIQENIPIVLVGNKKEHKDKIIKYIPNIVIYILIFLILLDLITTLFLKLVFNKK